MSSLKPSAVQIAQQQAAAREGKTVTYQGDEDVPGRYGLGSGDTWRPRPVKHIDETGLNKFYVADLILKILYFTGYMTGYQVAEAVALPFTGIVDEVMEFLKEWLICHILESDKHFGGFLEGRLAQPAKP